jgi:hypothetical protein
MARWTDKYIKNKFGPKLAEYEITNEDSDGYPYTEYSYILVDDIPEKYKTKFLRWVLENKIEICVEKSEQKHKGTVTEYVEKKAVNSLHWEKWYSIYR